MVEEIRWVNEESAWCASVKSLNPSVMYNTSHISLYLYPTPWEMQRSKSLMKHSILVEKSYMQ